MGTGGDVGGHGRRARRSRVPIVGVLGAIALAGCGATVPATSTRLGAATTRAHGTAGSGQRGAASTGPGQPRVVISVDSGPTPPANGAASPDRSQGRGPALAGGPELPGAGGRFAGYLWRGQVSDVAASWSVPRLAADSRLGRASTWIGAQSPGSRRAPFIQIGVQEELRPPVGGARVPQRFLAAFWSDTARHFHPQPLFPVRAGDAITASLDLADGRWTLSIADAQAGRLWRGSTRQEAEGDFNLALFLQEDVTASANGQAFPYPDLGPTRIGGLSVNTATPSPDTLASVWMALPGGYLGPGPLHGGTFTIGPRRISSAGERYLAAALPQDTAANRFVAESVAWSPTTPQSVIRRESDAYAAALRRNVLALDRGPWPAVVRGPIERIVRATRRQIAVLSETVARSGAPVAQAAFRTVLSQAGIAGPAMTIRRRLGLATARY